MWTRGLVRWLVSFRYLLTCYALLIAACGDDPKALPDGGMDAPPKTLSRIEVTPINPHTPVGVKLQLTATGVYSDATTKDLTSQVAWTSSSAANVMVAATGIASAMAVGDATITAKLDSVSGTTTVTATAATLSVIAVTPINPSVPAGRNQTFTATAVFSDSTTQNVTDQVTWASSPATIAQISNDDGSRGLATGLKKGDAVITATFMGMPGVTMLKVSDALLESIEVTPVNQSVPAGRSQQFTATGKFSDTTTRNLTDEVAWTSSDTAVAQVSNADGSRGVAKGLARGTTTITATLDNISAPATFTVTDVALVSIGVTPVNPSVPLGLHQAFTATGTFTDDTTLDLTNDVTWESSDTTVAQISNADDSHGVAATLAKGTTDITAKLSGITGTSTLTVADVALVSIAITPVKPSVPFRFTQAFAATGTFTDTTTRELTAEVAWSSSDITVAQISNADGSRGVATGLKKGTVTITAKLGTIENTMDLTVTDAVLVSIAVAPKDSSVPAGLTQSFTATGTFSDASTRDLTNDVAWGSSDTAVAQISNADGSRGTATGLKKGSTVIAATLFGVSGTTSLTVTDALLVSLAITPDAASVPAGRTQAFTALGTFSDASSRDLTADVTWSSSDTDVAQISNADESQGVATGVKKGAATIIAKLDKVSAMAALTVTDAVLVSIAVTPDPASVVVGQTQAFIAHGTFSDTTSRDLTGDVAWSSSDTDIAQISNADGSRGEATGVKAGDADITATLNGIPGTAKLAVTPPER
jgi:Big-like domain-containing protein